MPRMSKVQREERMAEAVALSARGKTWDEIAEELGINRKTAMKLVDDELSKRGEHRIADREASIARNLAVIREAWRRLETTDNRSLNVSGLMNTIIRAGERIDKLTGAEAPIKHQRVKEEYVVEWDQIGSLEDLHAP